MIIKIYLVVNINLTIKSLTIFSHLISDPETLTVRFFCFLSHCNYPKLIRVGLHAVFVEPVHESLTF